MIDLVSNNNEIRCTNIQSLEANREPKSVWKNKKHLKELPFHSELKHLIFLFKVTGVSIEFISIPMASNSVATRAAALLSICCFMFITSEVLFCGITSYVTGSVVAFNFAVLFMSLILWIDICRKKEKFSCAVSNLIDTNDNLFERVPRQNLKKQMIGVACYTCILPLFASLCSLFLMNEQSISFYLHCYMYGYKLTSLHYYYKIIILLVFLTIENFVHFFFPNIAAAFIFYLYQCLHRMIKSYDEEWQNCISNDLECRKIYDIFETYAKIRGNFVSLRNLTSLPVLLLLSQKFLTLFFVLSVTLSGDTKHIFIEIIESTFFAVNAIFILFLIILSGSRIREVHQNFREKFLDWWLRCRHHSSQSERLSVLSMLKSIVERQDMTMTAAGVIDLTKGLFLQIAAALVTYGVIMVQLNH